MKNGERLKDWEKDRFVELLWKVKGISSADAPHTRSGPDVFHVGYKVYGSKKKVGHIFMDCLPYFREVK